MDRALERIDIPGFSNRIGILHRRHVVFTSIFALVVLVGPAISAGENHASKLSAIDAEERDKNSPADPNSKKEADESEEELDAELDSLLDQDLTSLRRTSVAPALDVEVSSVSRQKSTIGRSPAAVFVITNEMIRRSGYRSIPEVLRLAPGVQVSRIDGNKWSVSIRGEAGRFSDKLLVQIDGRSVYNPLFAGVQWDVQDLLLEDVERIEVIRGPGATIWGANAVNGVINLISKSSSETQGTYAIAGSGNIENGFAAARLGGRSRNGVNYRVWGKWYDRDELDLEGDTANDAIHQGRVGFRSDWKNRSCDEIVAQGQLYQGASDSLSQRDFGGRFAFTVPVSGAHLLTRWTRTHSADNETSAQFYYDRFNRSSLGFGQQTNLFDFDFQNRFRYQRDHNIIWGLGYRAVFDKLVNREALQYVSTDPERLTVQRFSAFAQDEMTLLDDYLYFTVGAKFSHNTFSNFEFQPSARLLWLPSETEAAWCAISRGVRTPSRMSATGSVLINNPFGNFPLTLRGAGDNRSENLTAYEMGYRQQTSEFLSWDATAYFFNYSDLHTLVTVQPPLALPYLEIRDGGSADAYGFEIAAHAILTPTWTLTGWYAFQRIEFDDPAWGLSRTAGRSGDLPRNQLSLNHSFDLGCGRRLDVIARYIDNLPAVGVPANLMLDMHYAQRINPAWSASIVARNLLDRRHVEFGSNQFTGDLATEIPRSVHAYVEWRR